MTTSDEEHLSISITGLKEWNIEDPKQLGRGLIIKTTRGDLRTIVHHDPNLPTTRGIIWVGGASGGCRLVARSSVERKGTPPRTGRTNEHCMPMSFESIAGASSFACFAAKSRSRTVCECCAASASGKQRG